jgi:predicted RNA binding protein YcfA (HicA-like mRNA interferase family)
VSGRLPSVRGDAVVRALERSGFVVVRIKGSHHIMEHVDNPARRTVVPVHAGRDIKRGLLRKIIDDAGLTVDEFCDLL